MTSSRLIMNMGVVTLLGVACALPSKSAGENEQPGAESSGSPSTGSGSPVDSATSVATLGDSPGTTGSGVTGTPPGATGPSPDLTCRDGLECVVGCASQLMRSGEIGEDPDLSCFLGCEEDLIVEEAMHLLELTECVTDKCIDHGVCDALEPTGGEPDPGTSTGSGGGSGTGSGGPGPANPCLDCILANLFDEQLGGMCQRLADMCV